MLKNLKPTIIILFLFVFARSFIADSVYPVTASYYKLLWFIFVIFFIWRSKEIKFNRVLTALLILFFSSVIVSLTVSVNTYRTINFLIDLLVCYSIFMITLQFDEKDANACRVIILLSLVITLLRGGYQYFWGYSVLQEYIVQNNISLIKHPYLKEIMQTRRIVSFFPSPNLFAGYISMMLLVCFGIMVGNITQIKKIIIFIILFFTGLVMLFFTKSIGALIGFLIGLLVFFIIAHKLKIAKRQKRKVFVFIGCFLICLLLIIAVVALLRLKTTTDSNISNSFFNRLYYWKSAINMIRDNFIFGVGGGNFGIIYPEYKYPQANETKFVHNSFLQIFAENGIFPFIVFILITGHILSTIKYIRNNFVILGVFCAIVSFFVHNLLSYSFYILQVSFLFWLLLGIYFYYQKKEIFILNPLQKIVFSMAISLLIIYQFCDGLVF
ncbi:MAG: O-antigen ligase family protein [Candidatus Omnitrophota bacterium]